MRPWRKDKGRLDDVLERYRRQYRSRWMRENPRLTNGLLEAIDKRLLPTDLERAIHLVATARRNGEIASPAQDGGSEG